MSIRGSRRRCFLFKYSSSALFYLRKKKCHSFIKYYLITILIVRLVQWSIIEHFIKTVIKNETIIIYLADQSFKKSIITTLHIYSIQSHLQTYIEVDIITIHSSFGKEKKKYKNVPRTTWSQYFPCCPFNFLFDLIKCVFNSKFIFQKIPLENLLLKTKKKHRVW